MAGNDQIVRRKATRPVSVTKALPPISMTTPSPPHSGDPGTSLRVKRPMSDQLTCQLSRQRSSQLSR